MRIEAAYCQHHGAITPDGMVFPLTATAEALRFMAEETYGCAARGCEGDIVVLAEPTDKPLLQHLVLARAEDFPDDYEHDKYGSTAEQWAAMGFEPGKPRVIIELGAVEPGVFAMGVALDMHGGADQDRRG